uniref:Uncharacterized protein n=1 Tax=Cyprinodon variegatus TaxID=28743 RepID=A0A3Q2E5U0_CYPVA
MFAVRKKSLLLNILGRRFLTPCTLEKNAHIEKPSIAGGEAEVNCGRDGLQNLIHNKTPKILLLQIKKSLLLNICVIFQSSRSLCSLNI